MANGKNPTKQHKIYGLKIKNQLNSRTTSQNINGKKSIKKMKKQIIKKCQLNQDIINNVDQSTY